MPKRSAQVEFFEKTIRMAHCKSCFAEWAPIVEKPVQCPRCKALLIYLPINTDTKPTNEVRVTNG